MKKKTVSAWPVIPRMTKQPNFGSIKFSRIMFGIHNVKLELIFSLIFNEHEADLLMSYLETHVRHLAGSHSLCAAKSGLQL